MNNLNRTYRGLEELGATPPISRVTLYDEAGNAFSAGDDTGFCVEGDCAWATQAMTEAVLAQLVGYEYHAYAATGCYLDPAAELGDPVSVGDVYSVIASIGAACSSAYVADIGAPIDGEVDHEFTCVGTNTRRLKRTVQLGQTYFGTTITRKNGLVIEKTDGENVNARVTLNADNLAFCKLDPNTGTEVQCFYYDAQTGQYVMNSGVDVDDAIENSKPFYEINASVNGLSARVGDAEGNLSTLTQTANSLTTRVQNAEGNISSLEQTIDTITLGVSNGTSSSTISLQIDGVTVASKTIKFTGGVVFESDLEAGNTSINGACIDTGTILAQFLKLYGEMEVYKSKTSSTVGGYIGWCGGYAGNGIGVMEDVDTGQCICTSGGARLSYGGDTHFSCTSNNIAASQAISEGSDRRIKNSFLYDIPETYEAMYRALKPCRYKRNDSRSDRYHTGFVAQEIEEAVQAGGLESTDLAAYCIDDTEDKMYSVRYTELIALNTAFVQKLMTRVDELEERLKKLEGGV